MSEVPPEPVGSTLPLFTGSFKPDLCGLSLPCEVTVEVWSDPTAPECVDTSLRDLEQVLEVEEWC